MNRTLFLNIFFQNQRIFSFTLFIPMDYFVNVDGCLSKKFFIEKRKRLISTLKADGEKIQTLFSNLWEDYLRSTRTVMFNAGESMIEGIQ